MDRLVDDASALAASRGLLIADTSDPSVFRVVRFALLPTPLRRHDYDKAVRLTSVFNKLTLSMAADRPFLTTALHRTAAVDRAFTGRLFDLHRDTDAAPAPAVQFAVNRYDFFADAATDPLAGPADRGLLLVELNTVAAGGVQAGRVMQQVHEALAVHPAAAEAGLIRDGERPVNNQCDRHITECIVRAHRCFETHYGVSDARVVMVVAPPYMMRVDHGEIQWHAMRDGVDMLRMTLAEIAQYGTLSADGHLQIRDFRRVALFTLSVAYFRSGYTPDDFPTEREWDGRRLLELSTAASCPSVAMQLVGTKKIQQMLGDAGVLERFLSVEEAALVRETLVQQWDASDEAGAARAVDSPDSYIMKPQREGGGNNLCHEDMQRVLKKLPSEKLAVFTLMERIHTPMEANVVVEGGKGRAIDVQSELGVFGSVISVDGRVIENRHVGVGLRNKPADSAEGNVNFGGGGYGSVVLI